MTVAAAGFRALHLEGIRTLLADCAAFQTWAGAEDATEAKASIYIEAFSTNDNLFSMRPWCLIGMVSLNTEELAVAAHFATEAVYTLTFEANIDADHDFEDAGFTFLNAIDEIIEDIMEKSDGTDGEGDPYVRIASMTQDGGPERSDTLRGDADGDAFREKFTVTLGGWS